MKSNIIQYDTIYNEIQYTILTIYYNEQWNTIYNEIQYDTMHNMIQWTIWYNIKQLFFLFIFKRLNSIGIIYNEIIIKIDITKKTINAIIHIDMYTATTTTTTTTTATTIITNTTTTTTTR